MIHLLLFSGGCDGCLNWEGVEFRHQDATNKFMYPNIGKTNNNGMGPTVVVLEHIYTDREFPKVFRSQIMILVKL